MAGERVIGQITIDGTSYKTALQPIQKTNGDVMGAIFVGTPMANVEAAATSVLGLIAIVGGAAVIGFGLGTMVFGMFFLLSLYMQQVLGFSALQLSDERDPLALTYDRGLGDDRRQRSQDAVGQAVGPELRDRVREELLTSGLFNRRSRRTRM